MKIVHWKLITKRIFRRIRFIFFLKDMITWEYESCIRCGHCYRVLWKISDEKWNAVKGDQNGCLCIDCFLEMANNKNIVINANDIQVKVFNP